MICSIWGTGSGEEKYSAGFKKIHIPPDSLMPPLQHLGGSVYDPKHPTSRGEDLENKMRLLDFVSGEMGLVTGSEDGVDAAVPFVDYLKG